MPGNWTVTYGYNNANEKTSVAVRQGTYDPWTTTYDYYKNGWLANVDGPADISVDYTYDAAGKPEKEDYGNGTFAEYAYSNAMQLSALKHWKDADSMWGSGQYSDSDEQKAEWYGMQGAAHLSMGDCATRCQRRYPPTEDVYHR